MDPNDDDKAISGNQTRHEALMNHIILPRYLPQLKSTDFHSHEQELAMRMVYNVKSLANFIPKNTVKMFDSLEIVHRNRTANVVAKEINDLQPGETFGMFVRLQNCAIMIHRQSDAKSDSNNMIVATFPGRMHPNVVYKNPSDVEFDYPMQAIKVKNSKMLRSTKFAQQLCVLYEKKPKIQHHDYVSNWLVTTLMNESSSTAHEHEFPVIKKKIRDEILGEPKNHFRRSGFYMCVKVMLQHSLNHELGPDAAKLLYKIIMLQFLSRQSNYFNEPSFHTLNIDLVTQTLAKLARRIEKLRKTADGQFKDLKERIIGDATHTIQETRTKIDKQIKNLQSAFEKRSKLAPLVDLNFEADIYQKVPQLRRHIHDRLNGLNSTAVNPELQVKTYKRHYMKHPSYPDLNGFGQVTDEIEKNLFITDFENWILYDLDIDETYFSSNELRRWCTTYISHAGNFYEGDQLGVSRSVLVCLKMLAILDKTATRAHPMLLQHNSGINTKVIDTLLLPYFIDMQIAFKLEQYFNGRNSNGNDPSLIGQENVNEKSFSAKFAARSSDMQTLRREIEEMIKRKIDEKKREWSSERIRVQELRRRASMLSHDDYYSRYFGQFICRDSCQLCELQRQIKKARITVYERALSDNDHEKNAVVFELKIPLEIACLRDTLQTFVKYCNRKPTRNLSLRGKWINYAQISHYNRSASEHVHLGSTTPSVDQSETKHVDEDFSSFNRANGFNCTFQSNNCELELTMRDDSIKQRCTLQTENEYSCLQWTLKCTSHTQNQVFACQSECPQNLSLLEFQNFGSMRADGHRLQWRKLYAMIETEALSFENTSVLSLVLQSIWETELSGAAGVFRESHEDIASVKQTRAITELLSKFVEKQQNNWVHPLKLLMASLVIVRVFELNANEELAQRIATVLDQIRTIALDWVEKIQNAIKELHNPDPTIERELRMKLVFVAVAGALTFSPHSRHEYFNKIFLQNLNKTFSSTREWLQFIVTLNSNIILSNCNHSAMPKNLQILLRLVRNTGIHIESTIRAMIEHNPRDIYELIKKQWTPSEKGRFEKFYFHPDCQQVLVVEVHVKVKKYVTIDLITGAFLVNNLPVCRLPDAIIQSKLFQRVFKNFVFEVQPDAEESYSSVQRYNGNSYEFINTTKGVIITERRSIAKGGIQTGVESELVPSSVLEGEIAELLIENHSHWWNKATNKIEFRPKLFRAKQFSADSGIEYTLDLMENLLFHVKTRRNMLDITSDSYQKIVNKLTRLERHRYIHVLMDEPKIAKVELVRMQLKFKVDCYISRDRAIDLLSNEFSNMRVSLNQNCGTFYGLNHGLLLESVFDDSSKPKNTNLLLLPNGKVETKRTDTHVTVDIDIQSDLRNPPFFAYQVDEFCRQLKPNSNSYSAWFYLAYLHALTSLGEIEPFTGISGTERALQILQSGYAWSSAPYDGEAAKTLQDIAQLSPVREKEDNMQKIKWPSFIPPNSAQDTFVFIVQKLLSDSDRLCGLYFKNARPSITFGSQLNVRDYLRCLESTPNLRISGEYIDHKPLCTSLETTPLIHFSPKTQNVILSYHKESYLVPQNLGLKNYLMFTTDRISGPIHINHIESILNHDGIRTFDDLWLSLYEVCRKQLLKSEPLALIWSLLAHEENHIGSILALQAIYQNSSEFSEIDPPSVDAYIVSQRTYNESTVESILKNKHSRTSKYNSDDWSDTDRKRYNTRIEEHITELTRIVTRAWPCDSITLNQYTYLTEDINIYDANKDINTLLMIWNNNRRLGIFLDQVESKLHSLPRNSVIHPKICPYFNPKAGNWQKYEIDYNLKLRQSLNEYRNQIKEATFVWESGNVDSKKSSKDWLSIYNKIVQSIQWPHLLEAGLYPRTVPTLILPMLISCETEDQLKMIIGALAITIANEQRNERIETFSKQSQLKPAYDREKENRPHVNWKPSEYPEWLLFEIEQNLTIRRIQIEIAKRMINPPGIRTKHSTMQLNMGEGKTAVIVPILASVLADGQQVCQITVLKSLYATNLKSLRRYLGGMLARKIYTFPCRRDMRIDQYIESIRHIYEECMEHKGVILTLPEYRLSFQLKIYETVKKNGIEAARKFLSAHKWINANVRSILDESDAILHAKYQLIYTVGGQLPIDGGSRRWVVTQALLKRVPYHMKRFYHEHGEESVEFNIDYVTNGHVYGAPKVDYRDDIFTPCRILDQSIYPSLKEALIEDFLDGRMNIMFPEVSALTKKNLRELMSKTEIDEETFESTLENLSEADRITILILSGLLRFEVLKLVLTKRWRVNYGVNVNGTRKMAIPFKAKDVAAELTEFGHPDVAICLTILSYYYSGLSDDQMLKTFRILAKTQNSAAVYEKWTTSITTKLIDPSIESYSGVNLSDPFQREEILFPLFRFNMDIIDFFLSQVVFPREAKSFENKLICTAWDLCSEHMQHRVTGFSGTNDTKNILPMPIAQNDLAELENTNECVRQTLMQPENQDYQNLPANVSAKIIIEKLIESEISVLLDSGALMLELNNKQVAEEWLKMASDSFYDAAVYFDSEDVLQTIDRNGVVAEFDCSVYRENLKRCLVYLDDTHTRGTDLKFPLNFKACVTLSGEITRDKTVQACMRMRQLGKGHSIAFWSSFEADVKIRTLCKLDPQDAVSNENVIDFICDNSRRFEVDNTVHWASAAHNYTKKLAAHKLYENSTDDAAIKKLYEKCVDNEYVTLEEMYGDKEEFPLTSISQSKFVTLSKQYEKEAEIHNFVQCIDGGVYEKLRKQAPDVKRFVHCLDEEQEKELEQEVEEERQVERPPKLNPATPIFDEKLISLMMCGAAGAMYSEVIRTRTLLPFAEGLLNTKLFEKYKREPNWAEHLFVTKDFVRVLANSTDLCDQFLRPVWWIARIDAQNDCHILVLLSSFECDRLLATFHKSEKSILFPFRPTLSKLHSDLLDHQDLRVTAESNTVDLDANDVAKIKMYSGSMYFKNDVEQNAYCNFLGLIPRPRTPEQDKAFEEGIIKPNGFVPVENRQHLTAVNECVDQCRFNQNPVNLAIQLIEAHHEFMRNESHASSILQRGSKFPINQ